MYIYIYIYCVHVYIAQSVLWFFPFMRRVPTLSLPTETMVVHACMHGCISIIFGTILGYGEFQLIKVDTPFWGEVEQLSINKTIWIISLQHPINKGRLDKPFRGEDKVRVSISYIQLDVNSMCVCNVHIYTQSPKINKVFQIYEYQTCVFEEIQLGVKG